MLFPFVRLTLLYKGTGIDRSAGGTRNARPAKTEEPAENYHVIASPIGAWQSVTSAAQCAARPHRGRKDADCHGR